MRHSRSMEEYAAACDGLMSHLESQWRDRRMYWSLRSRAQMYKDVLVIIVDGMDRSKFALPRWLQGKSPKSTIADKVPRPVLELAATIVHGVGVYLWIADEDMRTGANWTSELLLRSIEFASHNFAKQGQPMPVDISVQGDNTVAELKNSTGSKLLAALVAAGYFRCGAHQHLRVGHTHEDVGSM